MTCHQAKQELALAALGADTLEAAQAARLEAHCRSCLECEAVWHEFKETAQACARSAAELAELPVPFHPVPPPACVRNRGPHAPHHRPSSVPGWILSGMATALLVTALILVQKREVLPLPPSGQSQTTPAVVQTAVPAASVPAPTLALYRQALAKSGDDSLDALLERDANRLLRGATTQELRDLNRDLF